MKPDKIFLIRHGESTGNLSKEIYKDVPDYALQLTDKGKEQAREAGRKIDKMLELGGSIQCYVSPFWRTRQTFYWALQGMQSRKIIYYEDPRLREQEWGQNMESREGYKDSVEKERDSYGHFYFRFRDGGESCADVFDRVSDFINTMFRDFQKKEFPRTVCIFTHGMTMRLFLMRWFHCSVEEFESWGNPKNGEYLLLERGENERYELKTPIRTHTIRHNFVFNWEKHNMEGYGERKVPIYVEGMEDWIAIA